MLTYFTSKLKFSLLLFKIMRNISFILLVIFALTSWGDNIVNEYHENGAIYKTYSLDADSLLSGMYKRYNQEGVLVEESFFENGKQNGTRTLYYANGNIESTSVYIDDMLTGKHKTYYDSGELMIDSDYKKSEIVGTLKKYYKSGQLLEEVTFKNDMENGPFVEYYENGNIKWKGNYLNGDNEFGLIEQFDETGKLIKKMECDSLRICKTIWEKPKES